MVLQLERGSLLADNTLTGASWCASYTALVDDWLASLLGQALDSGQPSDVVGMSLVAVGGYGRAELCPQSDLDVMLLRSPRRDVKAVSERVWYPIWDAGLKLGHSVCTQREALELADNDLDSATALLSARHIAGDAALTMDLKTAARSQWEHRSKRWLEELADARRRASRASGRSGVHARARSQGRVAAACATCTRCTGRKRRTPSSSSTTK